MAAQGMFGKTSSVPVPPVERVSVGRRSPAAAFKLVSVHLPASQAYLVIPPPTVVAGGIIIIDFPNLGITYNGGWCSATISR